MFVMSMHSSKVKIICVIVIVALCLGGAVIFAVKKVKERIRGSL